MDFVPGFSSQPRGLQNFISDIRNAKSKEDERSRVDKELANIRKQFSASANLSSYDKKKYVWKLCYIYMLGYEVDFGHVEFISLLSSTKFQEKMVGYMAFSMMFRPGDELMTLAVNSMRNDIVGQLFYGQTLALSAVSNMGGSDLADALSGDVQRLVASPSEMSGGAYGLSTGGGEQNYKNKVLLCKKASLCLLRLFRTNPECLVLEDWMRKIAKLLEDRDFGVITSVMSLLLGLASNSPSSFEPLVPYVVSILSRLAVSRTCAHDYLYYNTPSPWLHVKCFRFLQYYKIPSDPTQVDLLMEVLGKVLVRQYDAPESSNKANADNAILFEAINLVVLYGSDCPSNLREHAIELLGRFLAAKDPNIRYLSVDAMTKLTKLEGPAAAERYQPAVLDALRDTDISLRKRALNLLYVMAYDHNAREIVNELVLNLPLAEPAIKEDIVVKSAILAERFGSDDLRWYIDTMVQIMQLAGDYVAEAVWYRLVQIVINSPDIHEYTAQKMLSLVQSRFVNDVVLGTASYLLGEIGVNICELTGSTGFDQFAALHQHYSKASVSVQAILLTTYAKLVNLYPEQTKDLAFDVFNKFSSSSHLEIQQRSTEYLALGSVVDPSVTEQVLNTMPAFELEAKENILLTIDAKESNEARNADRSAFSVDQGEREASRAAHIESQSGKAKQNKPDAIDRQSQSQVKPQQVPTHAPINLLDMEDESFDNSYGESNDDEENSKLLKGAMLARTATAKVDLFKSSAVSLLYTGEFRAHQGRITLFIRNKSNSAISNVQLDISSASTESLRFRAQATTIGSVASNEEQRFLLAAECLRPFSNQPSANIKYVLNGREHQFSFRLPVCVSSFCTPLPSDKATYMARWKAITAENTEAQSVFNSKIPFNSGLMSFVRETLMTSMGIGLAEELDNDRTFTGSTSFTTGSMASDGKPIAVGALLRLEADPNLSKCRITVRSTQPIIAAAIKDFIVLQLS